MQENEGGMKDYEIDKLIERFERSGLGAMEYEDRDFRLRLERDPGRRNEVRNFYEKELSGAEGAEPWDEREDAPKEEASSGLDTITSPIVGSFYAAEAPGRDPFAPPGAKRRKGETLCLIEAMKMMNEIKAPYDLVVKNAPLKSGEMVECGSVLFEVARC